VIDIVKDQPYGADYVKEEDPKLYISEKTKRGPLEETWLEDYWSDVEVYNSSFLFFIPFLYFFQQVIHLINLISYPLKYFSSLIH